MIVDGVNFIESACVPMGKARFVKEFETVFFQDRPLEQRRQVLSDAYDMMSPPEKEGKKKKSASKEDIK